MEAIKCPVCGSGKVQKHTEEEYVCLACDNIFPVYNRSKEHQETNKHIDNVNDNINKRLDKLEKNSGVDVTRVKEILFEAEENLENGNYDDAFVLFKKYDSLMPDSDEGYDGICRTILAEAEDDLENGNYEDAYARFEDYTSWDPDSDEGYDGMGRAGRAILLEAEDNLANGNYSHAYEGFKKYADWEPDSYVGYEGMYRTASCTNVIRNENDLYNGFDVLKKALECEDCDKEELLEPILKEFQASGDKFFYEKLTEEVHKACSNAKLPQTDLAQDIQQLIKKHEDEKKKKEERFKRIRVYSQERIQNYNNLSEKEKEDRIKKAFQQIRIYNQESIQNYNNLSEKEKENRVKLELLPPVILFLLSLFVFHGLLSIVSFVVSLVWGFIKFMLKGKPLELAIIDSLGDKFNEEQQQIDYWKNNLEKLNSRTDLQISDMEEIICNEYTKGLPADAKKYRVVLTEAGTNLDVTMRAVRELKDPDSEGAENVYYAIPAVIMEGADIELVNSVKAKFEKLGATIVAFQQN